MTTSMTVLMLDALKDGASHVLLVLGSQ